MKYLLDTHVILWWVTQPHLISAKARKIISNRKETVYVSSASFWEMAIKQGLGKLSFPLNLIEILQHEGFSQLPISVEEGLAIAGLPNLHQDPFDRMLIVQAKLNDLVLITRDKQIQKYPVVTVIA